MDDEHFDDLLRKKLRDYEDPVYDPSSLASLRERMAWSSPAPWYARRPSTSMVLSSLLLFTLINAAILYFGFYPGKEPAKPTDQSEHQTATIDSLYQVVTHLQGQVAALQSSAESSVRKPVTQHEIAAVTPSNVAPIHHVKSGILSTRTNVDLRQPERLAQDHRIVHPTSDSLSNRLAGTRLPAPHAFAPDTLLLATPVLFYAKQATGRLSDSTRPFEGKTSLSTQKAIEKNYYHGIGIAIGPHLDLEDGIFSQGSGRIAPRLGVTSDWIFSPSVSMELGADYQNLVNVVKGNSLNLQDPETAQYGTPQSVRRIANLLLTPLALKYRTSVSARNQLIAKVGATPYFNIYGETQYTYLYSNGGQDNDAIQLTTVDHDKQRSYFGTALTAAVGLTSKRKKNHDSFETSLFYERTLGATGFSGEGIQLVGLRTGYWFHLR